MKKLLLLTLALIFLLALSACGGESANAEPTPVANEPVSGESISNDFRLRLHADKSVYRTDEAIQIHATIEYIGEKETQNMEGGGSVLVFSVTDGADFNMDGLWLTELRRYGFKKGVEYVADFVKSGGYDAYDPMADFWEEFYDQEELFLPPGTYTVSVSTTILDDFICSIEITVVE